MANKKSRNGYFVKNQKMIWSLIFIFVSFFLFNQQTIQAQNQQSFQVNNDSVYRYFPDHSPSKATWMSAALPGLGQFYNGKYWKIPIIYAGFSTMLFFVGQNKYEYNRFKEAYAISVEIADPKSSNNPLVRTYDSENLLLQREYYQSNLELSYILTGVFYLLQIVDATVDAHLYDYDIDEDLSIRIEPQWMPTPEGIKMAPGIGLRWKLSKD